MAIKCCYKFDDATVGPAVFNWTVLILKESNHSSRSNNNFEIVNVIIIESCDLDATSCTSDEPLCCDVTNIESFDLPQNFIFGVTESAQGNTARATLLGYHDSLPKYQVDVVLLNKAEVTLSVGSTIHSNQTTERGIRMLWFVIGKLTFTIISTIIIASLSTPMHF